MFEEIKSSTKQTVCAPSDYNSVITQLEYLWGAYCIFFRDNSLATLAVKIIIEEVAEHKIKFKKASNRDKTFAMRFLYAIDVRLQEFLRKLNSVLKRKECPLPTIEKMFPNIRGFIFASTIDLNMGYLSIPLTIETQKLLTIVTQFGFFECRVLPMGIRPATDIFQSRMVGIFMSMGTSKPNPYIDDIFHGKGSDFDSHLEILNEIFQRLKEAGMQVNLTKSTLCAKEVEFLGFLLKQSGYQPTRKRIEAILKILPPKNVKKVREFLGAINFIKNHIPN